MAVTLDYVVILVLVSAFGAFLFLASTLIFLVEETAKFLIRFLRDSVNHFREWAASHAKTPSRVRSAIHKRQALSRSKAL